MSESWSNKYRPTTIDEVVGQDRVKNELKTLNKNGKMPKTILLTGDSGIGKTTLAYIISKLGKCTNLNEDGSSCNQCSECIKMDKLIMTGQAPLDLAVKFINVSKLNKSDDAEEVIADMSRQNSLMKYNRYFILDEVHVATELGQSRYLKVTEEKPQGLNVIMTTTNEEKILEPLKSRFIKYKLVKPRVKQIVERLTYICQQEGVNYQVSALNIIAKNTNRNLRMAIDKLEELSSFGDLTRQGVLEHYETLSEEVYYNLITGVRNNNLSTVSNIYNSLEESNVSFNHFVKSFGEFIVDLIDISNLLYPEIYTQDEIRRYKEYVESFTKYQLMGLIRITNQYYNNHSEDKFVFYSFATELMSLFNSSVPDNVETPIVQTEIEEVSSEQISKKYRKITEESKEVEQEEIVDAELNIDNLADFFGNTVEL